MSENEEDLRRQLEEAQRQKEELEAQLMAEKAKQTRAVYLKVSQKGGASLYGIRRFPVTFYLEEWNRILDMADTIRKFLTDNDEELTRKP